MRIARLVGGAALAALMARPLFAQSADSGKSRTPDIVHYGKWGAAAVFAGLTTLGVIEHDRANSAFDRLTDFCLNVGPCGIGQDGRYSNPAAESRYQEVVSGDRAARVWLLSGQIALAGTATLFIIELMKNHSTTNIPFHGLLLEPGRRTSKIGWRLDL
ncbi:MAG TPA: hypothetical protein VGI92_04240 [Gemmatimonadales bacterium]|jgi:hypothetical protein